MPFWIKTESSYEVPPVKWSPKSTYLIYCGVGGRSYVPYSLMDGKLQHCEGALLVCRQMNFLSDISKIYPGITYQYKKRFIFPVHH